MSSGLKVLLKCYCLLSDLQMIHTLAGAARQTLNESTATTTVRFRTLDSATQAALPSSWLRSIMQATVVMRGHDNVIIVCAFTCSTLWFMEGEAGLYNVSKTQGTNVFSSSIFMDFVSIALLQHNTFISGGSVTEAVIMATKVNCSC